MEKKARVIAFYLPQFHPIPENDLWWGKGFTEWTNVAKAKPLYKGHYQPHIPADLGFYDLRVPEVREEQAKMAREAGVEGFCYWHYWMGKGKMLLERPFDEVLNSGHPDYPFCLGWANGDWSNRSWQKSVKMFEKNQVLMAQYYSLEDYRDHFFYVLKAFKDPRYITVDGKPLFYIHDPLIVPKMQEFIKLWRKLAVENGLKGIYFVGRANNYAYWHINEKGERVQDLHPKFNEADKYYQAVLSLGFDAVNSRGIDRATNIVGGRMSTILNKIVYKIFKRCILKKYNHADIIKNLYVEEDKNENIHPTIVPNWDRSPREGKMAAITYNSTPKVFEQNLKDALDLVKDKTSEHQIIFLQAWNEWAEGNHVEPDLKYGHGYLNVLKKYLFK